MEKDEQFHGDFPPLGECLDPVQANEAARRRISEAYGDHNPLDEQFERLMARYVAKHGEAVESLPTINVGSKATEGEVVTAPVNTGRAKKFKDAEDYMKRKGIRRW